MNDVVVIGGTYCRSDLTVVPQTWLQPPTLVPSK